MGQRPYGTSMGCHPGRGGRITDSLLSQQPSARPHHGDTFMQCRKISGFRPREIQLELLKFNNYLKICAHLTTHYVWVTVEELCHTVERTNDAWKSECGDSRDWSHRWNKSKKCQVCRRKFRKYLYPVAFILQHWWTQGRFLVWSQHSPDVTSSLSCFSAGQGFLWVHLAMSTLWNNQGSPCTHSYITTWDVNEASL